MNPFEYCKNILVSESVSEKLKPYSGDFKSTRNEAGVFKVESPARGVGISFSEDQVKFPKAATLREKSQRGKALHFFANHELLAIEMMAQAICQFSTMPENLIHSLMDTISDEQKHFKLYEQRMNEFGVKFGDFPLNAFFWKYMEKIDNYQSFFAVVALTFEQANLDFAKHYESVFREVDDPVTANILKTVYDDEIKHVARGHTVLKRENPEDIWNYYKSLLPKPLTPARAKGNYFDEEGRRLAGLSHELISQVRDYRDDFKVTKRKSWKS